MAAGLDNLGERIFEQLKTVLTQLYPLEVRFLNFLQVSNSARQICEYLYLYEVTCASMFKGSAREQLALEAARHRAYMEHLVAIISPVLPAAMLSGRAQQMVECLAPAQSLMGLCDTPASGSGSASASSRALVSKSSAQSARRGVIALTGHAGSGKTSFAVRALLSYSKLFPRSATMLTGIF